MRRFFELEEPFDTFRKDLLLDHLSLGIEASLREMLGESDLPELPKPGVHDRASFGQIVR